MLFILATTEPQSIPATILSRCQRFDFHRIGVEDIISCVRSAVNKAGAEIDDEGLLVIARAAEGGASPSRSYYRALERVSRLIRRILQLLFNIIEHVSAPILGYTAFIIAYMRRKSF